jgi:hypothetical protein
MQQPQTGYGIEPADKRKVEIQHDHSGHAAPDAFDGGLTVIRLDHVRDAEQLQQVGFDNETKRWMIVHNQDSSQPICPHECLWFKPRGRKCEASAAVSIAKRSRESIALPRQLRRFRQLELHRAA